VNNTTAATKKLGTLITNFKYVMSVNRSGSFLYVLGLTSATVESIAESFSVYALTSTGVPTANPVQTLVVKPALTQFVIHPSGKFAYAEYSWEDTSPGNCQATYYADIVLYTINPKNGKLTNTTKPVANFPCNAFVTTSIFGLNSTGTELYVDNYPVDAHYGDATLAYYRSTINAKTGTLGPQVQFWSDAVSPNGETSAFTNSLIAQTAQQNNESEFAPQINIYPNTIDPTTPIISCTPSTLPVCGNTIAAGDTVSGVYFLVSALESGHSEVPEDEKSNGEARLYGFRAVYVFDRLSRDLRPSLCALRCNPRVGVLLNSSQAHHRSTPLPCATLPDAGVPAMGSFCPPTQVLSANAGNNS
jgi:hypothetical protein